MLTRRFRNIIRTACGTENLLHVDAADSLEFVKLNFYAVNYVADVWLNDFYLGYHEGGYTPFSFDVFTALNYGGHNVLVVRVDNPMWNSRNDIVPIHEL